MKAITCLGRGYLSQLMFVLCWFTSITILVTGGILWKQVLLPAKNDIYTYYLDLPPQHQQHQRQQLYSAKGSFSHIDNCRKEYEQANSNRTRGLTSEDLEHSRALIGNRHRLAVLANKLVVRKRPVTAVVCGGSISLGHGLQDGGKRRYSHRLQEWLNAAYPLPQLQDKTTTQKHHVLNHGSHGADICAMAKRINILIQDLVQPTDHTIPDLFVLEFAVNDYQGQDFKLHLDHKTDVFFPGFERLALCAEVVVHKLLDTFPNTAVVFLEMQTAIANRKTAALLHMGVAKHYQVPVISYAETMFPDFYRLMHKLKSFPQYSTVVLPDGTPDPVLPYPHGCVPCIEEHITEAFRPMGCKSLCVFAQRSGEKGLDCTNPPHPGRQPCYVSFLSHDAVHLSAVGHQIASDLIAEAITTTARDICRGRHYPDDYPLPKVGFMVADPSTLKQHSDFVFVNDTMEIFSKQQPLRSDNHSSGFALDGDSRDRPGWIATNPKGGEYIEFIIDLPPHECYAIYLAVLKSYEHMGTFQVTVTDLLGQPQQQSQQTTSSATTTTTQIIDSLWEPHISIPSDVQITSDDETPPAGCTGKCKVTITTNPEKSGRGGNKVKIVTLSARKCMHMDSSSSGSGGIHR